MRYCFLVAALAVWMGPAVSCAAPERVTPILVDPQGSVRGDSYAHVEGGTTVEMRDGRGLPLVEHEGTRALRIRIEHSTGGSWHVGIARRGWARFYLEDYGGEGTLQCELAGVVPPGARVGIVDVDKDGAGPDPAVSAEVALEDYAPAGAEWRHVTIPLRAFVEAAPDIDLDNMDKVVLEGPSVSEATTTLYLADLKFCTAAPERTYPPVKVDQVGYPADWRKVAKVTPASPFDGRREFVVREADTGRLVHSGVLEAVALADETSGDNVYDADFTAVRTPGTYVLEVEGLGRSEPFRIGEDVYGGLFYDVSRFWFFQRCGMELKRRHAGPFAHRACHVFDQAIADPRGGVRDCRGGWHDAGDMNRYTAWTIGSVPVLLALYRHHPDVLADGRLEIPESGNGLPDLLDEVRYELQWLRKMIIRKGPDAGQVYDRIHRTLVEQPPDADVFTERHGLSGTTVEACCAVVANMTYAHMVYARFPEQEQFAGQCLEDALLCWDYLKTVENPPLHATFSAAAVVFEATGRDDAHRMVKALAPEILDTWQGHLNYGNYDVGLATYALSERPEVDRELQRELRAYYRRYADAVVAAARSKGYREPMIEGVVFTWGSNGACIAKSGVHLLTVNRFAPNAAYVETARNALHWLLGRNPVDTCMVTGHGTPPLGPIFHAMFGPVGPDLPMPPGYLAGGPTNLECPGISLYPARAWRPDHTCWQLTEPSLGYQGPFTYLLGALMDR